MRSGLNIQQLDHWNTTPEVTYTYGRRGRRIRKQYFTYSGGWVEQSDLVFLYDGWNLVAELDANASNAKVRTYVWGTDLSGSLTGAGGVGGLLKVTYYGSTTTNAFVAYDGHGNVGALVDAANGTVAARYEYGPFAEPIRVTGPMAKANPISFSTKYTDRESDFLYYGYRYYSASTGRWLSRDPIEERGGQNLHNFLGNNPIAACDRLGLAYGNPPTGPNGPEPPPRVCPLCICLSVGLNPGDTVSTIFSAKPPFPGSPAPATLLLGVQVPYRITVLGDPKGCRCKYRDAGFVRGTLGGLSQQVNYGKPQDTHYIPCQDGIDVPGIIAGVGLVDRTFPYSLDYAWSGTVTCYGSLPYLVPMQASASIAGHYEGTARW
jgi:RHS repeat-associated protein